MNWPLEAVVVPAADVYRAKEFYAGSWASTLDHKTVIDDNQVVQLTPPEIGALGRRHRGGLHQTTDQLVGERRVRPKDGSLSCDPTTASSKSGRGLTEPPGTIGQCQARRGGRDDAVAARRPLLRRKRSAPSRALLGQCPALGDI